MEVQPITLLRVTQSQQQSQWKEAVNRKHALWRINSLLDNGRRGTIGMYAARQKNLQQIVCNSRFLILPWVKAPNLASHILSIAKHELLQQWPKQFGVTPLMIQTLVDSSQFKGTCYRAANYIRVGETSGRG
jgi:hypothetical protein